MNVRSDPTALGGRIVVRNRDKRHQAGCVLRALTWCLAAWLTIGHAAAMSAEPAVSPDVLRAPERAFDLVTARQQDAYRNVLAAYAREEASHADDAGLVVARCTFSESFSDLEDLAWTDTASEDADACEKDLEHRFPGQADATLYVAEHRFGKDALTFARSSLAASSHWTAPQKSRLHAVLARAYRGAKQTGPAGEESLQAVKLDPATSQFVPALRYLCDTGRCADATSLLASTPVPATHWGESQRVHFASERLSHAAALAELQRAETAKSDIDPWLRVGIYVASGMHAKAAEALAQVKTQPADQTVEQYKLRVTLAAMMADGNAQSAALIGWRSKAPLSMPLLQAYTSMVVHAPLQFFSAPLAPLAVTLVLLMVMLACLPGLIAFPAFYRGTVRARLHKPVTPLFAPFGLRAMWLALGSMLVLSSLVPLVAANGSLDVIMGTKPMSAGDEGSVVAVQLVTLLISGLVLLPALRRLSWRAWLGDRGLKSALWVGVALVLIRLYMLWAALHPSVGAPVPQATTHDHVVGALVGAAASVGGAPLAMIIVAVLVPVYEELVFRGFVLGGLSRHLSFGWANALQALLFASVHFEATHFVFYFVLGLAGGWLVRRTRGLAASIGLHAANNAFATGLLLFAG